MRGGCSQAQERSRAGKVPLAPQSAGNSGCAASSHLFPCRNAADFHGWHTVLALELWVFPRM
jgi:hypothetical protein